MQARCQCGKLTADIRGEGHGVMCHCTACQRRTGSPFGMMVYFAASDVSIAGASTEFTRVADSGDALTHGFCPTCGTPLWLKTARHPDGIGIAVGAIEGSVLPPPVRSVFEDNRHGWVMVPDTTMRFPRGRTS